MTVLKVFKNVFEREDALIGMTGNSFTKKKYGRLLFSNRPYFGFMLFSCR